jgi:DNA-binding protein H-NS
MQLKSMSIDKLAKLKDQIEAVLGTKVNAQRRMLESELAKITRVGPSFRRGHAGAGKIAPKYRNPENPTETWAGRGLRPRWLTAALKSGMKVEQFAIGATGKTAAVKKTPKKSRKARKK